jgi:hypothetical protein
MKGAIAAAATAYRNTGMVQGTDAPVSRVQTIRSFRLGSPPKKQPVFLVVAAIGRISAAELAARKSTAYSMAGILLTPWNRFIAGLRIPSGYTDQSHRYQSLNRPAQVRAHIRRASSADAEYWSQA